MSEKVYDVDLPSPKFGMFDPVFYDGMRTEIANNNFYYAYDESGVMCPWYYIPIFMDGFISIQLVPETDLKGVSND
ncbi:MULTISPECIES: hypothetical protein [unclassified Gilliamella]|uniref:hypothetical protein n=1 Tax=unclassified Gilliamella TaxID=2685620 RepID=UPI0013275EA0|nr:MULTISPECIES: hypothetical protein [unclassified Gilliamella]MWN30972.1 hypothetical protein [Gilliamella sp. Pra-s60]MWP28463.1 hypothetical protein [Gilliamella sp. Pra-s54]